ncbi:hypothetical protein HK097_005737, partial [Rhizophlyctis rosea]
MGFADSFSFDKPKETVELVIGRVKRGGVLEDVVAGYLRERAQIEEQYAQSLARLARKPVPVDLGTFAPVWEQLTNSTVQVSQLHTAQGKELQEIAKGVALDSGDTQWVKQSESELTKGAKDLEEKLAKYHKAVAKGKKKGSEKQDKKTADYHAAMEHTKSQWAPYAAQTFQKFQTIDEKRLSNIKDSLVRFSQSDAKHGASRGAISDGLLAASLSFDVPAETEAFCAAKGNLSGDPTHAYTGDVLGSGASSVVGTPRHSAIIIPTANSNGAAGPVSAAPTSAAPSYAQSTATPGGPGGAPLVDEEGYTIPPPSSKAPWESEFGSSSLVDDPEEDDDTKSMTPSTRLKVDIRNEAIVENPNDALNTMKKFAGTLPTVPTTRRKGTRRMSDSPSLASETNFEDLIRKRTIAPSIHSVPHNDIDPFSPQQHSPLHPARTGSPAPLSDEPLPLRISVTETINVLLKGGVVDKVLVTGEVALQAVSGSAFDGKRKGTGRIRLVGSEKIGRVVTNEAFAKVVESGKPTEWDLDLDAVSRQAAGVVICKYPVGLGAGDEVPVLVNPKWKCEDTHTDLVIFWRVANREGGVRIRDLSFLVTLEGGGEVGSVNFKPAAEWYEERRGLIWK